MTLKERIAADLKEGMKAKDQVRVDTLRSVLSAFSYRRIEAGHEPGESEQLEVLRKLVKQRNDSIGEFEKAGRMELVAKETRERDILQAFLPPQKSPEELRGIIREALAALAPDQRTRGAAMKVLMPQLKAEADGAVIGALVQEELQALTSG
jgi:uncharacterized protein YqeY